ncbi:hypothetical protein [Mesorhizobium sp.]|uniref:hypothetical protein n=1 Tax=Mesorhizobium sp. TaxID=1871066 RepID=UPI0025B8512B|nr:hypothetical protein [Mesorhizobium sp.]
MTAIIFFVGFITSIGCGWNTMTVPATWQQELVWLLGGALGTFMMLAAYGWSL